MRSRHGPSSVQAQKSSKVQVATEPRQDGPIRKGAAEIIASERVRAMARPTLPVGGRVLGRRSVYTMAGQVGARGGPSRIFYLYVGNSSCFRRRGSAMRSNRAKTRQIPPLRKTGVDPQTTLRYNKWGNARREESYILLHRLHHTDEN